MKLLIILFLFGYSIAQYDITFEQYMSFASQKNWPKDEETFKAFLDYCNHAASSHATESEGDQIFTKADCLLAQSKEFPPSKTMTQSTLEPIYDQDNVYYCDIIERSDISKNCK